ncbi:MAG TPA: fibronectin type III domain-containing protein [Verrucomicrobiae bacterium]|nr:fibronectin type III domain-containing protein [Verrucomicrobiae bacterium]
MRTLLTIALVAVTGVLPALAADRIAPSKPGNFRVTAKTPYSVSLAWNSSSDNSGYFYYVIRSSAHPSEAYILSKSDKSFTFSRFIFPLNSYTFTIQAKDAAGNTSAAATVTTKTPADSNPVPAAPVLSSGEVTPTSVSLAWVPGQGDGAGLTYELYINSSLFWNLGTSRSITVNALLPSTTYSFNVRARDAANRTSPLSNTLTVTTPPVSTDQTPPSAPSNLAIVANPNDCEEVQLTWTQSTDNESTPAQIRYDVFVNGDYFESQFGTGGPAVVYGIGGFNNVFEVIAVDANGNESEPGRLEAMLCQ